MANELGMVRAERDGLKIKLEAAQCKVKQLYSQDAALKGELRTVRENLTAYQTAALQDAPHTFANEDRPAEPVKAGDEIAPGVSVSEDQGGPVEWAECNADFDARERLERAEVEIKFAQDGYKRVLDENAKLLATLAGERRRMNKLRAQAVESREQSIKDMSEYDERHKAEIKYLKSENERLAEEVKYHQSEGVIGALHDAADKL